MNLRVLALLKKIVDFNIIININSIKTQWIELES